MNNRKILAIIPARGGSKGLKNKNIKLLNNKPLIAYTIEHAINSKVFDKIVVSTDSDEIVKVSKKYGAEVPYVRPNELATDESKTSDVIMHCLNYFEKEKFDYFCILQPTSPLRSSEDIKNALNLLFEKEANAVLSVCEMEYSPLWSNTLNSDLRMDDFISTGKRRQDMPTYYRLNGAIYFSKVDYYKKFINWYEKDCFAYIMPKERSIDIDDILDFKLAEVVLRENT